MLPVQLLDVVRLVFDVERPVPTVELFDQKMTTKALNLPAFPTTYCSYIQSLGYAIIEDN